MTRDPAATIRKLKEQSGKDIWLWGSLKLVHSLLDAGVVDATTRRTDFLCTFRTLVPCDGAQSRVGR